MAGIFLSYSRADREHAYRIVQGLRALGVNVWWDEDMPGVDWQYELEQRITDMAAVLVLWSKNSRNSNSVRDEARLADKKHKLINALVGLEEPPHPFDRNNGLTIDGWDGREPHRGWGRLVKTAESFIVGAGAAEPGKFMAELAKVEQDWQDRKQALALAQEAFGDAQAAVADAEAASAAAKAELSDAQKQLGKVGKMGFSIQVLAAAKEVCDAKAALVAEADTDHRVAREKLAEASRKLKRCTSSLQEPSRELPPEPITPLPPKPPPPEPVSPAVEERLPDEHRKAEAQRQADAATLERERQEREKLEEEAKAKAEADRIEQEMRDAEAEQACLDALAEAESKAEADSNAETERLENERPEKEQLAELAHKQGSDSIAREQGLAKQAEQRRLDADARAERRRVRWQNWSSRTGRLVNPRTAIFAFVAAIPLIALTLTNRTADESTGTGQFVQEVQKDTVPAAPPLRIDPCDAQWRTVSGSGTLNAYDKFVRACPLHRNTRLARERVAGMRCDTQWQTASREGTFASIQGFINSCGHHRQADSARRQLAELITMNDRLSKVAVCERGPYVAFFDVDKSNITPEAASILDNLMQAAPGCQGVTILVSGHTDRYGAATYNVGLSQRMAESVKSYLISRGLPGNRIVTQAFGETQPRVATADGVRELQNRRVEITFGPTEGM